MLLPDTGKMSEINEFALYVGRDVFSICLVSYRKRNQVDICRNRGDDYWVSVGLVEKKSRIYSFGSIYTSFTQEEFFRTASRAESDMLRVR